DPSLKTTVDRANPMRDFEDVKRNLVSRKAPSGQFNV
ncbi:hypothetical protein ig2599ANME_2359, partial [groundwater metagenome]